MEQKTILFDATGKVLGRLSTEIARTLSGKDRVDYMPNNDQGARVVVINAQKIVLTGNKETDKKYYKHSGYVGGLRETTPKEQREKDASEIIRHAVKGMLPKNKLARKMMTHLHIYNDAKHPYTVDEERK